MYLSFQASLSSFSFSMFFRRRVSVSWDCRRSISLNIVLTIRAATATRRVNVARLDCRRCDHASSDSRRRALSSSLSSFSNKSRRLFWYKASSRLFLISHFFFLIALWTLRNSRNFRKTKKRSAKGRKRRGTKKCFMDFQIQSIRQRNVRNILRMFGPIRRVAIHCS